MLGTIIFITISLSLGVNGFLIACPGKGCEDKCLADCQDVQCNVTYFAQLSPCSYGCIVNNQYSYHTEPDFQSCGTNKVCYQGQCLLSDSTYECQNLYGEDYISVENQGNPCTYLCVPLSGCGGVFSENIHNGCQCVVGYTNALGRCRSGVCIGNRGRYDPYYALGSYAEGGSSSIRATAENAATPRGYVSFPEIVAISNGITTFTPHGSLSGYLKSTPRIQSSEEAGRALVRPRERYETGAGTATGAGVAYTSGDKYASATAASSTSRGRNGNSAGGAGFGAIDRSTSETGGSFAGGYRRSSAGGDGVGSAIIYRRDGGASGSLRASGGIEGSLAVAGAASGSNRSNLFGRETSSSSYSQSQSSSSQSESSAGGDLLNGTLNL